MNPFEKYLNETMNMLNERSINKIQTEFTDVVNKMSAMAKEYAAAEGDEKTNILAELKGLTAKKNDLIKELDAAVAGKDKDVELAIKESEVNENTLTVKRQYTENHPAITVGKAAKIRNKVLEAIKDGKISQEDFDNLLKEMTTDSKRWLRRNAQYFNVSEDGISLSKTGSRILKNVMVSEATNEGLNYKKLAKQFVDDEWLDVDDNIEDLDADEYFDDKLNAFNREELGNSKEFDNNKTNMSIEVKKLLKGRLKQIFEATTKNPGVWVPGGFDKEIAKYPNSKITRELVLKAAKKWDVDPSEAIPYVEFGWDLDLSENKNTNMKTKFIYESFSEFVNALNESKEAAEAEAILNDLLDERGGDMEELYGMSMEDALMTVSTYGHSGSKANKIAQALVSMCNESIVNEAFASTKLASILTGANKMDKDLPTAFYNMSKIALDKVQDFDIIEMDPQTAKKEKRANAVYLYFTTNEKPNPFAGESSWSGERIIPANTLLAITDGSNEWMATEWQRSYSRDRKPTKTLKTSKRNDSAGIAKSGASDRYGSGISSMKQVAELADRAYCLDLDILRARYSTNALRDKRVEAKKGAIAFKTDKDFRNENMNRYNSIIANRAATMPIDDMVMTAINTIADQIKNALANGEKNQYGEIIVGTSSKGRSAKLSDAARHMQSILDDFQRYVGYTNEAEKEKAAGYTGTFYANEVKAYAKRVTDKLKEIETFGYAW